VQPFIAAKSVATARSGDVAMSATLRGRRTSAVLSAGVGSPDPLEHPAQTTANMTPHDPWTR
jgi:hypothetical protein